MKSYTFAPYFLISEDTLEECGYTLDYCRDCALDVIENHLGDCIFDDFGSYPLEPVLLDDDAKPVFIDLSQCSYDKPVSSYDIETIATALKMASTSDVIIRCFGKRILIHKDIEGFFSYIVGKERYRSPYEAAVYAINHWHEFEDDTDQQ